MAAACYLLYVECQVLRFCFVECIERVCVGADVNYLAKELSKAPNDMLWFPNRWFQIKLARLIGRVCCLNEDLLS